MIYGFYHLLLILRREGGGGGGGGGKGNRRERRACIKCWFQRLQYEGTNGFSQIWLVTVISHIPLVLADHCASSIFWLQL